MVENIIVSQDNLTISIPDDGNIYAFFLKESGTGSFQLVETTSGEKFGFEWTFSSLPVKGAAAAIIQYDEEKENPTFDSSKTYANVTFQYPVTLSLDIPANGLYVGETLVYTIEPSSATLTFSEEIFTDGVLTQLPQNDIIVTASADGYDSVTSNINKNLFKQHQLFANFTESSYKYGDLVTFTVKDENENDVIDAEFSAITGQGLATITKETGYSFTINKVIASTLSLEITKNNYEGTTLNLDSIEKIPTLFSYNSITYPNDIIFTTPQDDEIDIDGIFTIDDIEVTSPISNYNYSDYNNKVLTFTPASEIYAPSTLKILINKGEITGVAEMEIHCFESIQLSPNPLSVEISVDSEGLIIHDNIITAGEEENIFYLTFSADGYNDKPILVKVVENDFSDTEASLDFTEAYVGTSLNIINTQSASLYFKSESSPAITLIDSDTKVSSTSYGKATLVFSKAGYKNKEIQINFSQYKLKANPILASNLAGETQKLSVMLYSIDPNGVETAINNDNSLNITWESSNSSIVTIDNDIATYIDTGKVYFTPYTPLNYAPSIATNEVEVTLKNFILQCEDYILQTTKEDTIKAFDGDKALDVNWSVNGPATISSTTGPEIKIRAIDDSNEVILTVSKKYYKTITQKFSVNPHIADVYQEIHNLYEEIQKLNLSLNTLTNTTIPTQISEAIEDLASKSSVTSIINWAKAMEKYFVMPATETKITE